MAEPERMGPKPLTGRKVLLIAVAAFGVVIAANLAMLLAATGTFPGLVVKNSYVASQGFDAKTAAQRALGWRAEAVYDGSKLLVTVAGRDGAPVAGIDLVAVVGRPASDRDDIRLALARDGGAYTAPLTLAPGTWRVEITGTGDDGASFEARAEFYVRRPG
ncbi:MAG TPA: FixH family protein [Thermohalobaculum sp.]|nr:FixH family protein [Thermohalobaculum sp.]